MSLTPPNLDDRTFEQLFAECKQRIPAVCPSWTDLGESDPGIVLLQLFAYLTETMIYRLNRLPEKAYIEFLKLLGVKLAPPHAAIVTLRFSTETPAGKDILIPRGTRAAVGRSGSGADQVTFATDHDVKIDAGQSQAEVTAHHCDDIAAEFAATATGEPGLTIRVQRPPIIAPTADGLDIAVGVESSPEDGDERMASISYAGKPYRIWREVSSFANLTGDQSVYVLDRTEGLIQFSPAARVTLADGTLAFGASPLGAVPKAGREIRVWYRRGGGAAGNAAANTIDTLKDPIPRVRVINPAEATGGRDREPLENALVRGPQEFRVRDRAVTADDFEALALQHSGGVARAKAVTRAQQWRYATPGTVELLLVPNVPGNDAPGFRLSIERLHDTQAEALRTEIQDLVRERIPLGTQCVVNWARYKLVVVLARVVVYRQEDTQAVRARLLERVVQAFSPLPNPVRKYGWEFGETLRAFHVHDCAISEAGVKYVDRVRFRVDEAPSVDAKIVFPDPFQPDTWYASSGEILYRTLNNGDGWEPAGRFSGQSVETAAAHPSRPGLLAVVTRDPGDQIVTRIQISCDCGETWTERATFDTLIRSIAWMDRDGELILLLASDAGLYQLSTETAKAPLLVPLQSKGADLPPPIAVTVGTNAESQTCVAVALDRRSGVWLSRDAARNNSFNSIGLENVDARALAIQAEGARTYLWAATFSGGGDEGSGAQRWELTQATDPPEGWVSFKDWKGGSCYALAFAKGQGYAATHHGGVVRVDTRSVSASWRQLRLNSGLPLNITPPGQPARDGLARVSGVGADPVSGRVMSGGPQGVFRSENGGDTYVPVSIQESDSVTLPPAWLFCPAEPELEVISEDEAG